LVILSTEYPPTPAKEAMVEMGVEMVHGAQEVEMAVDEVAQRAQEVEMAVDEVAQRATELL
jgi:hypothetical protein